MCVYINIMIHTYEDIQVHNTRPSVSTGKREGNKQRYRWAYETETILPKSSVMITPQLCLE